jgi:predicted ester cyclase
VASEHHALMQRLIDTWNARDVDGFVHCYTEPLLVHGNGTDNGTPVTRDQHREAARSWWDRFPDLEETIDEIFSDGDRVFLRTTSRGTLASTWRGMEPTGEPVAWEAWYVYRVEDGLVSEERMIMDSLGLFVQLGGVEIPSA